MRGDQIKYLVMSTTPPQPLKSYRLRIDSFQLEGPNDFVISVLNSNRFKENNFKFENGSLPSYLLSYLLHFNLLKLFHFNTDFVIWKHNIRDA